jgi:hypothetical protein
MLQCIRKPVSRGVAALRLAAAFISLAAVMARG